VARVTFINAELSGKLGGTVYARNKGGAYVRQFVKPTNPRSQAQILARQRFKNAVTAWSSLTTSQKSNWSNYAINYYRPKVLKTGVTYSGSQSFISLWDVSQQANYQKRDVIVTTDVPGPVTSTFVDHLLSDTSPIGVMTSQLKNSATNLPMNVSYENFTLTDDFTVTFRLQVGSADKPLFVDPGTNLSVGYLVAMQFKKKSSGSTSKQAFNIVFAATGTNATFTMVTPQAEYLTFSIDGTGFPVANYKTLPVAGESVTLTLYHVNSKGAIISVASEVVTITNA
jgi:hypothetical protein